MKNLKKISIIILATIFSVVGFLVSSVSARSNVTEWYVKDFKADIVVNYDSSLDIEETIIADAGNLRGKHGIFRVLPTVYQTQDGNFVTPVTLISITDENGNSHMYQETRSGNTVTYKIGNPRKEVRGENTYIIKYRVDNTVRTQDAEKDELYFNLLGNFWDMEMDNFAANITFPEEINSVNSEVYLYGGSLMVPDNSAFNYNWQDANNLRVNSNRTINKREGVTVSVAFPKNIVTPFDDSDYQREMPGGFENVVEPIRGDNSGALPFKINPFGGIIWGVLIIAGAFIFWFKYGRDPETNRPVIAEFEAPEGLTPIEMGSLLQEQGLNRNSVTATIINLAVNGYLKIEELKKTWIFSSKDYKLIRTIKKDDNLYKYEKFILDKLFKRGDEVKLSALKRRFAQDITGLSSKLSSDLKERGLIDKKSSTRQILMIVLGVLIMISSFGTIAVLIAGFATIMFGAFMGRLTPKGAELKRQINGFKLYLNTAERYRARFYEKEGMMEQLLPYAILFGITKEWLKKMKEIYGEEYFNNYSPAFMAGTLALANFSQFESAINDISTSVSSHVSPSSSGMGGGGSVGGGGGGGGGGGW